MSYAGTLFDALTGVVFLALGAFVATRRPMRALGVAFAVYAIGAGVLIVAKNIPHLIDPGETRIPGDSALLAYIRLVGAAGGLAGAAGVLAVAWRLTRRASWWPILVGAALAAAILLAGLLPQWDGAWDRHPRLTPLGALLVTVGRDIALGAAEVGAALALALAAWRDAARDVGERRRLHFLSLGILPGAAYAAGDVAMHRLASAQAEAAWMLAFASGGLAVTSIAWVLIALRRDALRGRALVLAAAVPVALGLGAAGYLVDATGNSGIAGLVRLASILVLAYAILQHGLFLERPATTRTFTRTTLALALVAGALVGGKLGELLLPDPWGSLASLASVVALLAALAPLRRVADRAHVAAREAARSSEAPERIEPGALLLGRFRLERLLGEGGEGATWLCRDEALGRPVVAKVMPLVEGETHLAEARRLAGLDHPHIVRVLDVGRSGERGIVLMEYVPGGTLRGRLVRSRLARVDAEAVGADLLAALAECHARGIVHGDVKPENVLLDTAGRAKLADFGAARATRQGATTRLDHDLATIAYASPEQLRGGAPTSASDVYSAGLVLAECALGRHPLHRPGMDDFAMRQASIEAAPELDGLDPARRGVLEKALSKAPSERYPDAGAMRDAWLALADGTPATR